MNNEERPQFDTAVDALTEFLERMIFAATPRHMAESIVDELPWNGWKIVKMSDAERDAWETTDNPWEDDPEDTEINEVIVPSQPWFTAGPTEDNEEEDFLWPSS